MKKQSGLSSYKDKTKGAVMKFFDRNKDDEFEFDIGISSEIINKDTAAIISKLGADEKAPTDIKANQQATPEPKKQPQQKTKPEAKTTQSQPAKPTVTTSTAEPTNKATTKKAEKKIPAKQQKNTNSQPNTSSISFGIKDVIDLINTLPTSNPDVVIPVMIKTLESANIHLDDIISDAEKHEKVLEVRSHRLIEKIEELENKVANLNDEMIHITTHLDEISNVKNLLIIPDKTRELVDGLTEEELAIASELSDEELLELEAEMGHDMADTDIPLRTKG